MVFASLECMGVRRIEAAIMDNGTDMDSSMTPFDAGLGRFVDLDSDADFIGKAALRSGTARTTLLRDGGIGDHANRRIARLP